MPCNENRLRHLLTVAGRMLNSVAISFVPRSSAAASMIRALRTRRCSLVVDRTQDSRVLRSSSVTVMGMDWYAIPHL